MNRLLDAFVTLPQSETVQLGTEGWSDFDEENKQFVRDTIKEPGAGLDEFTDRLVFQRPFAPEKDYGNLDLGAI